MQCNTPYSHFSFFILQQCHHSPLQVNVLAYFETLFIPQQCYHCPLQVNVLAYFETLCTDTGAANVLINSSLTILVVRMLRNARAPTLRVRLASALGLLVRHATYIADDLATTGTPACFRRGSDPTPLLHSGVGKTVWASASLCANLT